MQNKRMIKIWLWSTLHGFAHRPAKAWCLAKNHKFLIGNCRGFLASICEWPLGAQFTPHHKILYTKSYEEPTHQTRQRVPSNSHLYSWSQPRFSEAASRSTPWRFQVLNWPPGVCRLNHCLNMPKQSLPQSQKISLPVLPAKLPYRCALPTKQVATWRCIHGQPTTTACVYMSLALFALMSWPWTQLLPQPFRPQALLAFRWGPCIKVGQADSLLQKLIIKTASRPIAGSITSNFRKPSLVLVLEQLQQETLRLVSFTCPPSKKKKQNIAWMWRWAWASCAAWWAKIMVIWSSWAPIPHHQKHPSVL